MSNKKEDLFGLNIDSEEEDVSLDEEEQEDSRFSKSRLQKQAFADTDSDDDSDSEEEEEEEDGSNTNIESKNTEEKENVVGEEKDTEVKEDTTKEEETNEKEETSAKEDEEDESSEDELGVSNYKKTNDTIAFGYSNKKIQAPKKLKSLSAEELEKFEQARKRTGVCYLSRIPAFMQPRQVRSLLSKHAEIGRIFMVPEDPKSTAKRKKYKKERRTQFIEGWVEFKDKKIAKTLAEHLNMKQVGGKRNNQFYNEIWNIKYLPKFKWHHLTEHRAHEKQARKQRLQAEIAQSNRENKSYIQNVERSKMLQNMEQKKRKREGGEESTSEKKVQRTFSQRGNVNREVDPQKSGKEYMDKMDSGMKNVLGSLFAKK